MRQSNETYLEPSIQWLSDEQISGLYTSEYWNNQEEEKKKEWWIEDGDYSRLWAYLTKSKLLEDYLHAERFIKKNYDNKLNLNIADLASGIGWCSALLSKLSFVEQVNSVDISLHRMELFPYAIDMLGGEPLKIKRYIGSFYETKFSKDSVDIVFLMQAFHHASKPFQLLVEIGRILKISGCAIIVGEPNIKWNNMFRRFLSELIKRGKLHKVEEIFFLQIQSSGIIIGYHPNIFSWQRLLAFRAIVSYCRAEI